MVQSSSQCTECWPPVTSTRVAVMFDPHSAPSDQAPATTSLSLMSRLWSLRVTSMRGTRLLRTVSANGW